MVDRLRLNLSKCSRRVKAVNLDVVAVLSETKIEGKQASFTGKKHNETLGRGQCLAALESKSGVVAESVGLVDVLQTSMASSSGPVEPKQQIEHEGNVTVGQMLCKLSSSGSLGKGMTHRRQRVSTIGGSSSENGKNS
ncbi:hypothetical protein ACOSP7_031465 [Xanthoceras sorbifolium]